MKVDISKSILEKHKDYLIKSKMIEKLKSFKKTIPVSNIIKDEHDKFIDFLIKQLKELSVKEIDQMNENMFLAKPKKLHSIIESIKRDYPLMNEDFKDREKYVNDLLDIFGYKRFSSGEMEDYYYFEQELLNLNIKKTFKKEARDGLYNEFILFLIDKIDKIILIDRNNYSISFIFNEIKNEISLLETNNISEDSFIKSVKEIFDEGKKQFEELELDKKSITLDNYNSYRKKFNGIESGWSAYKFLFELGIRICPYCSRQYITPVYNSKGKGRADLDHFFSKSLYPYLSMSIYNLVPSCKLCNSSFKGTKKFDYNNNINPYEDDIEEILEFDFAPNRIDSLLGNGDIKININFISDNEELQKKAKNNCDVFKIEDIYQYHSNIVTDLIKKRLIYSEEYIEFLVSKLSFSGGTKLFNSENELKEFIISNHSNESNKNEVLKKLKSDIIKQLWF